MRERRKISGNKSAALRAACCAVLLAAGVAVGVPKGRGEDGVARAKGGGGGRCSERTVRGTYAFALTGSVIGVGPVAASGTSSFDGEGNFSITGAINTTTGDPLQQGTFYGTYSVNPEDCTATSSVTTPGLFGYDTLHFRAVIVNRGEEIRYLITNPGIVFAGATVRQ